MSRRFEDNFSRRPMNNASILGAPPGRGGGGGGGGVWGNQFGEQQISRTPMASQGGQRRNDYGGGGGQGRGGNYGGGQGGGGGGGGGGGTWRQRTPSPSILGGGGGQYSRNDGGMRRSPERDIWGTPQPARQGNFVPNPKANIRPVPPPNQHQQPQVVMVQLPSGQNPSNNFMLQNQQNPFGMMQQQAQSTPMQLILPAFNADIGQQIMQASSGGYGGGMNSMNNNMMGGGGGRSQQYNPFEQQMRGDVRGGDSGRSSGGRVGRNLIDRSPRRSDTHLKSSSGGGGGGRSSFGNASNSSSQLIARNGRKRGGRYSEEVDRKRNRIDDAPISRKPTRYFAGKPNTDKKTPVKSNNNRAKAGNKKPESAKKAGDEKKAEVGKEKVEKKKEGEATGEDEVVVVEGEAGEKKKSKYEEFPPSLLVCKVCQKVMNDGTSYEAHLNGRSHLALVKILENRFQKRNELLMLESKLAEEEIAIETGRRGKGHGKNGKNFCKMCDCNYVTNWGAHKASVNHRILKEFLHPNCRFCNSQFVHRMDWVNHLFSLNHLKKIVELKEEGQDVGEHETLKQEELFAVTIDMGKNEIPANALTIRSPNYKLTKPFKEDLKQLLKDHKELEIPEEEEVIIPEEYKEDVAVGVDAVTSVQGWCCKLCRTYIAGNEKDVENHCKTKRHFWIYKAYLKGVVKAREDKKEAEKKAAEIAAAAAKKAEEAAKKAAEAAAKKEAASTGSPSKGGGEAKENEKEEYEVIDEIGGDESAETKDGGGKEVGKEEEEMEEKNELAEFENDDNMETEEGGGTGGEEKGEETSTPPVPAPVAAEPVKKEVVTPAKPPPATKQQSARRGGRGRGSPARGGYGRGARGGYNTPQNVQPKVETNMRGGGRGRGGQQQRGGQANRRAGAWRGGRK